MNDKTRTSSTAISLAVSAATLAWLVPHAAENGSLEQPTTYIGIAVGVLIVGTAWFVGRRRAASA